MNRTKIEWVDDIWNPITGCSLSCEYCYARKNSVRFSGDIQKNLMSKNYKKYKEFYILDKPFISEAGGTLNYPFGFIPTFHKYRLNYPQKRKNGCNILVGEMGDMFEERIPDEWINLIFSECLKYMQHNYFFISQNVKRYCDYKVPTGHDNFWYGTTITKEEEMIRFNSLPAYCRTFVNMEPILEDLQPEQHNVLFRQVDWIILGTETGNRKNKVKPKWEWIKKIILEADSNKVPVYMKASLLNIVGENNLRREFPKQLNSKKLSEKVEQRLYADCCSCKLHQKKREMITLAARSCRGEQPKQFGFMCKKCFRNFCDSKKLELPKLKNLENMEEN